MSHVPEVTYKQCDKCGQETLHLDGECKICLANQKKGLDYCDKHGLTKHKDGKCLQCKKETKPDVERLYCDKCKKESRHVNGQCMSCKEQALYKELECPTHGLTKHRGKTCCKCRAEAIKRKRQEKKNK